MVSVIVKGEGTVTEINILGMLEIYRSCNMKPNFSHQQRIYGIDRHTIKKYYENGGKKAITRNRNSAFEPYKEEIIELMNKPGVTKKAVYEYLKDHYNNLPSYSQFRKYTLKNGICIHQHQTPHVRFETRPGEQLQVDWKESIIMTTKHGKEIEFNIFSSTLGYSRYHKFIYSRTKTTEAFIRCLIDVLNALGGSTKHILTDNMTSVVTITNGKRKKHPKICQLEKDLNIEIRFCQPNSPETKGKVESTNRFLSWLLPYDGKFEDENELIQIIQRINNKVNNEINQTTNLPPYVLFQKEKEYLTPLPNRVLLDTYSENVIIQKVPPTLLVQYQGSGYSVPSQFINKRVRLVPISDKLYIYYNTELITIHQITNNKFNYQKNHYQEALRQVIGKKDVDIEELAKENLSLLENLINEIG